MSNTEKETRFYLALMEIENTIKQYVNNKNKNHVIETQIIKDIKEIKIILEIIFEEIITSDKLQKDDFENPDIRKLNKYFEISSRLRIHIKAFYLWIYNLYILINRHPRKDFIVSDKNRSILEKYCLFRHILITHKEKLKGVPSDALRYKEGEFDTMLMKTSFNATDNVVDEVKKIFETCKGYLSEKEACEQNMYEQLRILYRNFHKFEGEQKDVKNLIEKYGTGSDEPIILVEFFNDFCKELIQNIKEDTDSLVLSPDACDSFRFIFNDYK